MKESARVSEKTGKPGLTWLTGSYAPAHDFSSGPCIRAFGHMPQLLHKNKHIESSTNKKTRLATNSDQTFTLLNEYNSLYRKLE